LTTAGTGESGGIAAATPSSRSFSRWSSYARRGEVLAQVL
jgi:hypothetical protein